MTNTWPGWENAGLIGEGSFGKVYRIRREEFGKTYEAALKVITIPTSQADVRTAFEEGMNEESVTNYFRSFVEDIVAEFALMSELKGNSNIVSYEDHMVVEHEDGIGWDILIRMELLTALPDYAAKHPLKEADAIRLGMDMARALTLCRRHAIIHRDIKPENIFVSKDGNFKLGDFGVARIAEKTVSAMSKKGTYNYMAPEVYKGQNYGYAADLYSLGLVLYRFLNDGRTPFLPPSPERIQYKDRERALSDRMSGKPIPPPVHGNERLKAVVLRACAYRPEERYGDAKELEEALRSLAGRKEPMSGKAAPPPSEPAQASDIASEAGTVPKSARKKMKTGPGRVIGIDLGASKVCMAVMQGGRPVIIPSGEGERTIPAMAAVARDGSFLAGEPARRQAITNSEGTVFSIRRCLETDGCLEIQGKRYALRDMYIAFLRKLITDAENYLGERVTKAVIAVPADFGYVERQAVLDAGRAAGLEACRILNGTAAVAWAYAFDNPQSQTILVYDLGGGGLDVAVAEIGDGIIEMLAARKDGTVSGEDFDCQLAEHMRMDFRRMEGLELARDRVTEKRLLEAAEKAKKELSSVAMTHIYIPYIVVGDGEPRNLEMDVSRATFEGLTRELVDRTAISIRKVCEAAGVAMTAIDRILPVGGATRIPAVWELLKKLSGRKPVSSLNPDECAALGAALECGKLENDPALKEWLLLDVMPAAVAIETAGGKASCIIEKNVTIPFIEKQVLSTAVDYQTAVDVHLVQGEKEFVEENRSLGRFRLDGIAPARKGVPQIQVSIEVAADGIIRVWAQDLNDGGREIPITWLEQGVLQLGQPRTDEPEAYQQNQAACSRTAQEEEDLEETISVFTGKRP